MEYKRISASVVPDCLFVMVGPAYELAIGRTQRVYFAFTADGIRSRTSVNGEWLRAYTGESLGWSKPYPYGSDTSGHETTPGEAKSWHVREHGFEDCQVI